MTLIMIHLLYLCEIVSFEVICIMVVALSNVIMFMHPQMCVVGWFGQSADDLLWQSDLRRSGAGHGQLLPGSRGRRIFDNAMFYLEQGEKDN